MKTNFLFMAFYTGKESTDGNVVKRYIGVAPVKVLAVNPTKAELEKIYNTTLDKDIDYTGVQEVNGENVKTVRIDFIVTTVGASDDESINLTTKVSYFLRNEKREKSDKSKVQVIDKYGNTAWVTPEQLDNHEIPVYKNNQPATLDKDYRAAFYGEEDLTNFLKAYLNIPRSHKYVNGKWVLNDNPSESEARLDTNDINAMFNGNFASIKEIIKYQPNNKVKVMFGVKTNKDGKRYQSAFTQMVLKSSIGDYSKLDAALKDRKDNGAYPTTEFSATPIKEYVVEATDIQDMPAASNPSDWFKK